MIPVETMLSVKPKHIVLSVNAQLGMLETHIQNATHVCRSNMFYFLLSSSSNPVIFTDECLTDDDCPLTKACVSQECVDPCLRTSCGSRAECQVEYHRPHCYCPISLQGNPLVSCDEVGCRQDEDCRGNERCEYLSQNCVPLCQQSPCAVGASCVAQNHREICNCIHPLQGDGYTFCDQRKLRFILRGYVASQTHFIHILP